LKYFVHKPNEEVKKVVDAFKKANPKSIKDIKRLGFSIRHIGNGAFREVYKINGRNLVIKIVEEEYEGELSESSLGHHSAEIKHYTKIMTERKFRPLRKYIPEIYYHNKHITLVKEYETFFKNTVYDDLYPRIEALGEVLHDLFNLVLKQKRNWRDFNNSGNIGFDKDTYTLVVLDLGCF
jgi:hypothetical protein